MALFRETESKAPAHAEEETDFTPEQYKQHGYDRDLLYALKSRGVRRWNMAIEDAEFLRYKTMADFNQIKEKFDKEFEASGNKIERFNVENIVGKLPIDF